MCSLNDKRKMSQKVFHGFMACGYIKFAKNGKKLFGYCAERENNVIYKCQNFFRFSGLIRRDSHKC